MEGKLESECGADECHPNCTYGSHSSCGVGEASPESSDSSGLFGSKIGAVPWSLREVILASAIFVPVGLVGSFGLSYALVSLSVIEDKNLAAIVGSILLPIALLAGAWHFGVRRHHASLSLLGFRRTSLVSVGLLSFVALAIGVSITGVYALLVEALGIDILAPEQNLEDVLGQDGIARLPAFAIVGLLAPFSEEVFFRGFLLAALAPLIGGMRGAVVSSAIFAAAHLNIGTLLPIFVMGMLLAWLYLRTGSLWPSFVAHAAQNVMALVFLEIRLPEAVSNLSI